MTNSIFQPSLDMEQFVEHTIRQVSIDCYSDRVGEPLRALSHDTPVVETMLRHVIERSLTATNSSQVTVDQKATMAQGLDSEDHFGTGTVTLQDTLDFLTPEEHPAVEFPENSNLEAYQTTAHILLGWFQRGGEQQLHDVLHALQNIQDAPDRLEWIEDYVGLPENFTDYDQRALQYYLIHAVCAGLEDTVDLYPEQPWAWREPLIMQYILDRLGAPDQDVYGGAYDIAIVHVDRMIEDDEVYQYDAFKDYHMRL